VAQSDTILAWYGRLIARKFDGSKDRLYPGRPRIDTDALIVRMAGENTGWGYEPISRALANLSRHLSLQTAGNIVKRYGIAPATEYNVERLHCRSCGRCLS
jgi:putative transposase